MPPGRSGIVVLQWEVGEWIGATESVETVQSTCDWWLYLGGRAARSKGQTSPFLDICQRQSSVSLSPQCMLHECVLNWPQDHLAYSWLLSACVSLMSLLPHNFFLSISVTHHSWRMSKDERHRRGGKGLEATKCDVCSSQPHLGVLCHPWSLTLALCLLLSLE